MYIKLIPTSENRYQLFFFILHATREAFDIYLMAQNKQGLVTVAAVSLHARNGFLPSSAGYTYIFLNSWNL